MISSMLGGLAKLLQTQSAHVGIESDPRLRPSPEAPIAVTCSNLV